MADRGWCVGQTKILQLLHNRGLRDGLRQNAVGAGLDKCANVFIMGVASDLLVWLSTDEK